VKHSRVYVQAAPDHHLQERGAGKHSRDKFRGQWQRCAAEDITTTQVPPALRSTTVRMFLLSFLLFVFPHFLLSSSL